MFRMANDISRTGAVDDGNCPESRCGQTEHSEQVEGPIATDRCPESDPRMLPGPSELDTASRDGSVLVTKARTTKKRHRRGKNLHRHRLSRRRRDRRARGPAGPASARRAAPRNDNEFLMSQYTDGLLGLQTAPGHGGAAAGETGQALPWASPAADLHHCSAGPPCWEHPWSACWERDAAACPSPSLSSPGGGGSINSGSIGTSSDYSSLSGSTPDIDEEEGPRYHYRYHTAAGASPFPAAVAELTAGCGVVTEGTDADFLRRNFEEEYASNLTRSLEGESREELIAKCLGLMSRLKELEDGRVARTTVGRTSRDARVSF